MGKGCKWLVPAIYNLSTMWDRLVCARAYPTQSRPYSAQLPFQRPRARSSTESNSQNHCKALPTSNMTVIMSVISFHPNHLYHINLILQIMRGLHKRFIRAVWAAWDPFLSSDRALLCLQSSDTINSSNLYQINPKTENRTCLSNLNDVDGKLMKLEMELGTRCRICMT